MLQSRSKLKGECYTHIVVVSVLNQIVPGWNELEQILKDLIVSLETSTELAARSDGHSDGRSVKNFSKALEFDLRERASIPRLYPPLGLQAAKPAAHILYPLLSVRVWNKH
jgi:hypothetical protein